MDVFNIGRRTGCHFHPIAAKFLKRGLAVTATVFAGGHFTLMDPRESHAQAFPDLVVANGSDPAAMTRAAVDALGGMGRFVKPGNKVVLKAKYELCERSRFRCNYPPRCGR